MIDDLKKEDQSGIFVSGPPARAGRTGGLELGIARSLFADK